MRIRKAAPVLACLLALLSPCAALALSTVCEEAFLAGETDAPPRQKAELYARCLETGQPDDVARAMILYNRGNMHRLLGQPQRALEDYGAAIRLNKPRLHEAYNNRGGVLLELGRLDAAIADFDQALRLKPKDAFAFCNRGNAYFRLGQFQRAITDQDQALRIDPDYSLALSSRAEAHVALGQFLPAIEDFSRAVRLQPDFAPASNGLAWLLATCSDETLRDGKAALAAANTAVSLERSATHLDTLAAAQARAGMHAEAVRTQEEALALLRGDAKAKTRAEYQKRLALYQAGKAYAEPERKP